MTGTSLPATLRLPHPYLTTYRVREVQASKNHTAGSNLQWLQVSHDPRISSGKTDKPTRYDGKAPPERLHSDAVFSTPVSSLSKDENQPDSDNTAWARARRYPTSTFAWTISRGPTVAQAWLLVYALLSLNPDVECVRLSLNGTGHQQVSTEMQKVGLAFAHPKAERKTHVSLQPYAEEVIISRATFWQGAGSPFGSRPAWALDTHTLNSNGHELQTYPSFPLDYIITTKFPTEMIHARHPRRPPKPVPGSLIYSRYIPHLDEHFSILALDYEEPEHLRLFHEWQNDPRVAAGWNETGTLEEHRTYLRNLHEDPHTLTMLARFDDSIFAYFEVYWAKEDHYGVHSEAGDYDRGRHSLVGDVNFRGQHRVSAWWSSLMHYMFIDEPRTQMLLGEPKYVNTTVISYDLMCGFGVQRHVDLPHKRSMVVKCSRERFFQLCPLHYVEGRERMVGGTFVRVLGEAKL